MAASEKAGNRGRVDDSTSVQRDVGYDGVGPQARTRKRKRFQHGNYTGYYLTRYGLVPGSSAAADTAVPGSRDPRINLLQRSWFEGKKCLDVGCNEGDLTLALVRIFRPRRMVGVDIDGYLVQRAKKALTTELSVVADAARRRAAEGGLIKPDGSTTSSGDTVTRATGGAASLRPLMPRSLRGSSSSSSSAQAPCASGTKAKARIGRRPNATNVVAQNEEARDEERAGSGVAMAGVGVAVAAAAAVVAVAASDAKINGGGRENGAPQAEGGVVMPPSAKSSTFGARGAGAVANDDDECFPATRGGKPLVPHSAGDDGDDVELLDDNASYDWTRGVADDDDAIFLSGCAVSFRHEDFVAEPHGDHGYDVVCLFSVVKWMHLNHGDEGLRIMFRKVHALLRPGGRLVLEPQPWKSYKKSARQHGSAEARVNAGKIKLRPADFPSLLTREMGFRSWEEVGFPGKGVGGFANRSVHVFVK